MSLLDTLIIILFSILVILHIGLALCFFVLRRNNKIYRYRRFLLEIIAMKAQGDRYLGVNPSWRLNEFQKVSYNEMVCKFWKRLDSFYPDKSFLEDLKLNRPR